MGSKSQARKRQRRNKSARRKAERAAAIDASRRIAEDIELGRYKRLRMCTYKRAYDDELRAIRAAIESSKAFAKPFRYYQCPYCGLWHLTSSVDDNGFSRQEVGELREAEATYLETPEQEALVVAALDAKPKDEFFIWDLFEIGGFASEYLALYGDVDIDGDRLREGFAERCEEFGFEAACSDRFSALYPERALFEADALAKVADGIDDINLMGSVIFFRWRYETRWVEEQLTSDANRSWFTVAFGRLAHLVGAEGCNYGSVPNREE